tara:strand:+ start:5553 stop:6152 length:600 start_codon:yes stop_codon:yes gene_type:complete
VKKTQCIEDFIGIYDGYLDDTICNKAIKYYEDQNKLNKTLKRSQYHSADVTRFNDETLMLTGDTLEVWKGALNTLMINFEQALREYVKETQILSFCGVKDINFTTVKIQKTKPGQGYHAWHVEKQGHSEMFNRVLAYTIYLNDVEEAGETEFLFQKKRVKPKTGRIAIWPSGFPYVHRGNPPLKETKYIVTSWMLALPN